jgi:F-type H+-transporting ATPase subunit b
VSCSCFSSAPKQATPEETANSLINLFPGSSIASKSGSVLAISSIAAWLISKEIYLLDAEVFEVAVLFAAYYVYYVGGKEGAIEYFSDKQNVRFIYSSSKKFAIYIICIYYIDHAQGFK